MTKLGSRMRNSLVVRLGKLRAGFVPALLAGWQPAAGFQPALLPLPISLLE